MHKDEKAIKYWLNHHCIKPKAAAIKNEVMEKTEFVTYHGIFDHHLTFCYISLDGYFYYLEFFGNHWNRRKPDKNGWCKYLTSLSYNIHTKELRSRNKTSII